MIFISLLSPWVFSVPGEKSNLVFNRARMKATAPSLQIKANPVQHLARGACVPSSVHCVYGPHGHWPCSCLRPCANGEKTSEQPASVGRGAREREGTRRTRERVLFRDV